MYVTEAVQPLLASIAALTRANGVAVVAHGRNCGAEPDFILQAQAQGWRVSELDDGDLHEDYIAPDVIVLRLQRE